MARVKRTLNHKPQWVNYDGSLVDHFVFRPGQTVWIDPDLEPFDRAGNITAWDQKEGGAGWYLQPDCLLPEPEESTSTESYRWSEVRVTSETGGQKGQKLAQLGSLDPQALLTLAEVSGFGAQKYAKHNFLKGYDWSLSFDATQRHLLQFWSGEDNDPESGLPHVAHAAWHCLALLAFLQRELGTDDRFKQVT